MSEPPPGSGSGTGSGFGPGAGNGSALERLRALQAGRTSQRPQASRPSRRGWTGALIVLALALWKSKALLLLVLSKLKLLLVGLQLLKLGKLATTGWTMLLSMWVYSMHFGAPFAVGFVLLILVHELGHGLAARLIGIRVGAPVFIPFFGALIALKQTPRTTFQDFVIGVGGPAAGSLGGLACLALSSAAEGAWEPLLYALAYVTLLINLFNLIPVWQLDGARITAPLRTSMWALAVALLALVSLSEAGATGELNPLALFILLAGGYRLLLSWRRDRTAAPEPQTALEQLAALQQRRVAARDLPVAARQRWIAWTSYVALATLLIVLVHRLAPGLPDVAG